MNKYLPVLQTIDLFRGLSGEDILALLACLGAQAWSCDKGQMVFASGESTSRFGIVLTGQVQVVQDDYYGNRSILSQMGPGQLFAESFACAEIRPLPVSVIATLESELLFIDCRRLAAPCARACGFHSQLIKNMLTIVSQKNIALTQKIQLTARRTTRAKLLAYLALEAKKAGSQSFAIPFNRQELADYLAVERSAMSAELARLREDGLLRYHKNQFELLQTGHPEVG
jgi:CRP/FNR family transcriptional regulator, dissimilatory nitrate respiration regulator